MSSAEKYLLVGKHHNEYFDVIRNGGPSYTLGKVFFVCWVFPLPLLPGESQYSSAFFRELQRLVQALVQVPLCLQTCWSTPLLFMQQDDLCVVRVG